MDIDLPPPISRSSPGWVDFWILLGAILAVALLIFYWAFAIRKQKHRIRKHRHHHHRPDYRKQIKEVTNDIRKRRSKHRHEHRPLNPTLSQTGGLPPLREAGQPPPPPPPAPPP